MKYIISLLSFDEHLHRFDKGLHIQCTEGHSQPAIVNDLQVEESGVLHEWMLQYEEWLSEQKQHVAKKGHPLFASIEQLHEFNAKGIQLVENLRTVLREHGLESQIQVEDFRPLYSNIEVGNSPCAWWHVRDKNYGFIVPIQHLPVSNDLKSRLMAWRVHKSKEWSNEDRMNSLNEEGHDLEQLIFRELNGLAPYTNKIPIQEPSVLATQAH
jgi:hypothetical protein